MSAAAPQRRIALLSASADSATDAAPLRLVESMLWAFQGTTSANWIAAKSSDSADVAVVAGAARNERIEAWRKSGKPLIVITAADAPPVSDEHVLVYPFRATQLLQLLNALDARLSHQILTAAPPAAAPTTNRNAWGFIESLQTLRDVQNAAVWVAGYQDKAPRLWVKGDGSEYITDAATLQDIRRGAFPFGTLQLRQGAPPPAHRGVRSAVELQWFAGCHAGSTLAPWLNESTAYRVSRWPNFGLIRPLPSQIRATALLAAAPLTLSELAKRGALPLEEAAKTLNALEACGVLVAVAAPAPSTSTNAPRASSSPPQAPGGIASFVRLLRKRLGLSEST